VKAAVIFLSILRLSVYNYRMLDSGETTQSISGSMLLMKLPLVTQPRVTSPVSEYTIRQVPEFLPFSCPIFFFHSGYYKEIRYSIPHTFQVSHIVMFIVHPGFVVFNSGVRTIKFALSKSILPKIRMS
jgi:hypothetical protein